MNRTRSIEALKAKAGGFDLVIVGGGATGLGSAVDAAYRGHSVALVEQADFAKGTSSRSTKLVHGGVRYLRQGNIPLVLEALRERGRLARNAPHLVRDIPFVIPSYTRWDGPFYGAGMKVYDQMAGKLALQPSRRLSREETLVAIPTVGPEGLRGGVMYHDGQFDDARLAINLAQTADSLGAVVANYCACTGFLKETGQVRGITARDAETGEEFPIRAKTVINATGIFVDSLRELDEPASESLVVVSQGIHFVLPKRFLPGEAAIMIPKTEDGRVLFAVPWHDRVVLGTTDTRVPKPLLEPRALDEEREFLMKHARKYLSLVLADSDVLSVFAGMRPLVARKKGKATAAISREHSIFVSETGLITITGGKWTTYRKMADDVVSKAESVGGLNGRACGTEDLVIHGGKYFGTTGSLRHYGSDAAAIADLMCSKPGYELPVHPRLAILVGEVIWHCRNEMARTVEDVLARRSRSLLLDAAASAEAAPTVARLIAAELGMTSGWIDAQIRAYKELALGYLIRRGAA